MHNTKYYFIKYYDPYNFVVVILDIWNYIESLRCTVADLTQRILKAQKNVEQIKFLINQWKDAPLFDRIDKERVEPLLNLTGINIIKYYLD